MGTSQKRSSAQPVLKKDWLLVPMAYDMAFEQIEGVSVYEIRAGVNKEADRPRLRTNRAPP